MKMAAVGYAACLMCVTHTCVFGVCMFVCTCVHASVYMRACVCMHASVCGAQKEQERMNDSQQIHIYTHNDVSHNNNITVNQWYM